MTAVDLDPRLRTLLGLDAKPSEMDVARHAARFFGLSAPTHQDTATYLTGLIKAAEVLYTQPGERWDSAHVESLLGMTADVPGLDYDKVSDDLGLARNDFEYTMWGKAGDLAVAMSRATGDFTIT